MTACFVMSSEVTARLSGGRVEIEDPRTSRCFEVGLDVYRVALEFASPRTPAEVHALLEGEVALADFVGLVHQLADKGLLRPAASPRSPGSTPVHGRRLEAILGGGRFLDAAFVEAVGARLDAGRAVVIPDALPLELAERVHEELSQSTSFRPYEGVDPFFFFHHHNLYVETEYPPALREASALFADPETKAFIARLARRPCGGPLTFSASLYLPGDHSLPHPDDDGVRTVAYVWHLTKNWDDRWGGGLFWCPTGGHMMPRFNALTLFDVAPGTAHFVSMVSAYATEKRLAVNGWWTDEASRSDAGGAESSLPGFARFAYPPPSSFDELPGVFLL